VGESAGSPAAAQAALPLDRVFNDLRDDRAYRSLLPLAVTAR
jgi:hypothetical protein